MIHKRGQLSRIDILQAQLQVDTETALYIAQQLGLNKVSKPFASKLKDDKKTPPQKKPFPPLLKPTSPSDRPKTNFWYCQQREQNNPNKDDKKKPIPVTAAWKNRPQQQAQHIPLLADKALLAKLQPYLNQYQPSIKVDVAKVVHTLSRGEYLSQVPRQPIKNQQLTLHIIDDRSRHLNSYWHDHHQVSQLIVQTYPQSKLSLSVLIEGEIKPQQITPQGLADWQVEANSTVLILSDLGVLTSRGSRASSMWQSMGRELQRKHCQTLVMLPCAVAQMPPYQSFFQLLSWESTINTYLDTATINNQVKKILTALSPAIRIEPELLRSMRLAMQGHGEKWQFPIMVESYVWQHAAIQEPHSVAASWVSETRQHYLDSFANLTKQEKNTALETIRQWRGILSEKIWYEEIISLDEESQQLSSIQADVHQAKVYFEALNTSFEYNETEPEQSTQAWFKRFYQRIPKQQIQASSTLQQISAQVFKDDKSFNPQWLDPQNLPKNKNAIKQAVLYQKGNQLYLKHYNTFDLPSSAYSPLALIKLCFDYVQVLSQGAVLGILELDNPQGLPLISQTLELKSDEETLILQTQQCPENGAMGRDQYGLFADISLSGITQRFRYIEPGTFMMGSPEDEKGRYQRETYHQVTLTKGYWLADTTCTQELWQAVMGDNPSRFKESQQNPVEQVSWLDTQEFLNKLNQQIPQLQLPTEAQWEYACRAGTQTPFNFEGDINLDKVNYRGTWDDYNSWGDGAKKETVVVKEYKRSIWGLYQMHGNVWEWCQDQWNSDLGSSPETDPMQNSIKSGSDTDSLLRVLRGGSWIGYGRDCRSAYRDRDAADFRDHNFGLRLSLGHELQPSPVSRSDKAETAIGS